MVFYIKDNDRVYFVDILRSDAEGDSINAKDYVLPSNIPIWNTGKDNETVVAMYSNKMGSYIRYSDYFDVEELCTKTLVREVVPKIKDKMEQVSFIKDNRLPNGIFVAKGDQVYRITTKGAAYNEGDYCSIGEYGSEGLFALKCSVSLPVKERINKVVKCVANAGSFPAYPIAVTDTVTRKLQVFNSEEEFERNFNPKEGKE